MKSILVATLMTVSVALAGGDTPQDAKLAGCPPPQVVRVKEKCPPAIVCATCDVCPTCPEPKVVEKRVEVPSKPTVIHEIRYQDVVRHEVGWVAAASGLYLHGPGLGVGGGYRWGNGVTLLGQALYMDRNGGRDGYVIENECRPKHIPVGPYDEGDGWGVMGTVVIPLKRGGR